MDRAGLTRLLSRLKDGDRAAFDPAFALLWPLLRAFCERYAGPDGEDAAQAAVLAVFSRASEFESGRDGAAWALGIAAWECRTLRRKRHRRREEPAAGMEPVAPGASPEESAAQAEALSAVRQILGTLRPLDAEAILAAAGSGPRGPTFRKRLSRALARFRVAWRAGHGSD